MSEPPVKGLPSMTESPFDALLRTARTDPEAAAGLVLAYADLDEAARDKLLGLMIAEGARADVLALMLGVEESPALAARIATALRDGDGDPSPRRPTRDLGYAWGSRDDGGAALVRELHGGFVEGVAVRWSGDDVHVETVPLARADEADALRRRLKVPMAAGRVSLAQATDRLAEGLWRLRQRTGSLPEALRPVADLLVPRA